MEDRLWTMKDVCTYLGVSARTFRRWRAEQVTPEALELATITRWVPEQIREWAQSFAEQRDGFVSDNRADAGTDPHEFAPKGARR